MSSVSPKAKKGLDNPLTAWYSVLVGWLRTKTDDLQRVLGNRRGIQRDSQTRREGSRALERV